MLDKVKRVTLKEIADELGVSIMSVSRALSNKGGIDNKKRRLIIQKAMEKGYEFNNKAIIDENLKIVAVCFSRSIEYILQDQFHRDVFIGISKSLTKKGIYLTLLSEEENELKIPEIINTQSVDGVIFVDPLNNNLIKIVNDFNIPHVIIGYSFPDSKSTRVVEDNIGGIREVTQYLIDQEIKKIYFLMYHSMVKFLNFTLEKKDFLNDRLSGYKLALIENKMPLDDKLIKLRKIEIKDSTDWEAPSFIEMGYEMMKAIHTSEKNKEHIGVVCVEDLLAVGARKYILEQGLEFKKDISLIGFDGIDLAIKHEVPLTTINMNKKSIGEIAVDLLLKKMDGQEVPQVMQITGEFYKGKTA